MTRLACVAALSAVVLGAPGCGVAERHDDPPPSSTGGGKIDNPTRVAPEWMGTSGTEAPALVQVERSAPGACIGGDGYSEPVIYDSWVRQRATHRNLCFEIWAPGVTDWNNPEVWRELDVRAVHRWVDPVSPDTETRWDWVEQVDRVGNNARYAFQLGPHDPLRQLGGCPDVPLVQVEIQSEEWAMVTAELVVYFTANDVEHRPSWDDEGFRVRYTALVPASCVAGS